MRTKTQNIQYLTAKMNSWRETAVKSEAFIASPEFQELPRLRRVMIISNKDLCNKIADSVQRELLTHLNK